MEIRIIDHNIKIFEEGSQKEIVALPLKEYDVIELFYLSEVYKTLSGPDLSSETKLEINSASAQICEVIADKLYRPDLGLVGSRLDAFV